MHLTQSLLRMSNHLYMKHIPGDILSGKHRVWPKLTTKYKRFLLKNINQEIENMKFLSKPFVTHEESSLVNQQVKTELAQKAKMELLDKVRANKNKIEDQYMSKHFENLRHHRTWE